MTKGRVLAALMAAITLTFVVQTGGASAQYPPPKGSLICAVSFISIEIHQTTTVSATLINIKGEAIVGYSVVFQVVGGYASSTVGVTDGSGTAYIDITADGSSSQIIVFARFDGLQCQAMAQVIIPPPPPVVIVSVITPPNTGDAGLAIQDALKDANPNQYIAAGGIIFGLLLLASIWQMAQRR
jgi:hypothetical protein